MTIELAKIYLLLFMFVLHCTAMGHAVLKLLRMEMDGMAQSMNHYSIWFFAISIGLVANILALFVLGLAGWMNPTGVLSFGLILTVLATRIIHSIPQGIPLALAGWKYSDIVFLILLFTATFCAALHAPGNWDDTSYHLPLARSYLEHEAIVVNEFLRFPLFPQNINLMIVLGLMLGGDLGAQAFATLPLFVMSLGLLGASLWLTSSIVLGALSTVTLFSLDPVRETLGYAYIDNGLALFCWGATLALAVWIQSPQGRKADTWLIVAGILAGAAAGSKYLGAIFAALLGIYVVLAHRDWRATLTYSIAASAVGIWWYARSFIISGDPVHPAGGNIFGHYLWDAADLNSLHWEQATHGVKPSSLDVFSALSIAGAMPLAIAIGSLLLNNLSLALRCLRFLFVSYLMFWFFVTQGNRYLAPIYACGVFLAWYVLYQINWLSRLRRYSMEKAPSMCALVSMLIVTSTLATLLWTQFREIKISPEEWQTALESRSGYGLLTRANGMIAQYGDRLVHLGFENGVYFFKGTAIGDWFGPGRYRQMRECDASGCVVVDPAHMISIMESFKAKMLAVSTDRFQGLDLNEYRRYFDIVMIDGDGVLMALKATVEPTQPKQSH